MPHQQPSRREFLRPLKWWLVVGWAAGVGGISKLFGAAQTQTKLKPLTVSGRYLWPSTKPAKPGCEDVTVCVEGNVEVKCIPNCDGCDECNNGCHSCNGCNGCDQGCDSTCNSCNKCNGCNGCDGCDASCNTCHQCDHGVDRCVLHCDSACDGCNQGNTCTIDINHNNKTDAEEIASLEASVAALDHTLALKRQALVQLRGY